MRTSPAWAPEGWHEGQPKAWPQGWEDRAACVEAEPELFFAPHYFERKADKDAREAKAKVYCRRCPVMDACREQALATDERHGVWGGLNERERRRLRRRRAEVAAQLTAETAPSADAAAG